MYRQDHQHMEDGVKDSPSALSKFRKFSRPKLTIPTFNAESRPHGGSPVIQIPISAIPVADANGPFGVMHFYPTKASEYVNKRYEGFKDFTKNTAKSGLSFGEKFLFWLNGRIRHLSKKWFTHIFLLLVVMVYSLVGAVLFVTVEGSHEESEKADLQKEFVLFANGVRNMARDGNVLYDRELWLKKFKELMTNYESQLLESFSRGVTPSEHKVWSFWNAMFYCGTIYTTIGYGHISPSTTTGRAITIIYAIFGIPMFLILLADFGKLFTRGIKFLWAFVRRLYYTGSCKKVRRTAPVQEMMKGVQLVYDFAKNRRPSQWAGDEHPDPNNRLHLPEGAAPTLPETPGTPNLSAFEIDDEFNLPISVAITILLVYIFVGATIYWTWEDWSFFESFYFVFISMSTIGFGDFVPQNPVYMMASIIYLVFGLALTSMCINVVQEKLTDEFRQASTKIGATIGLRVAEDGTLSAPAELADVNPTFHVK